MRDVGGEKVVGEGGRGCGREVKKIGEGGRGTRPLGEVKNRMPIKMGFFFFLNTWQRAKISQSTK